MGLGVRGNIKDARQTKGQDNALLGRQDNASLARHIIGLFGLFH